MTEQREPYTISAEEYQRMIGKRHKYGARRVMVDGISFPSKREADAWCHAKMRLELGEIKNLRRQVRYKLVMVTHYISDIEWDEVETGEHVVGDAKGYRTPLYQRKKKLMREQHDIEIREL